MKTISFTMTGTRPLLMNSDRGVDPTNPLSREIATYTSKRPKTLDDHEKIKELSYKQAIYHTDELGPYIPAENIHACIVKGAAKAKKGKVIKASVMVEDDAPLEYEGPRDIDSLYEEGFVLTKSVVVMRARVVRVRPCFTNWSAKVTVQFEEDEIDEDVLKGFIVNAGKLAGICDYRPIYGRFDVTFD